MLRLDRLIAPVDSLPFAVFMRMLLLAKNAQRSARIFCIARSTSFNWNNGGSDRIALVDVAPGDIGFLLTQSNAKHKDRRRNNMKHKWARACVVAALSLGLASPTVQAAARHHRHHGASQFAPGHLQKSPGGARFFAPGHRQTTPGGAKAFAPGHRMR